MLNFLIAVDGSPSALNAVRVVAGLGQRGAQLAAVLLNVQPAVRVGEVGVVASEELVRAEKLRAAASVLGPACLVLRRAGVDYTEETLLGATAETIAREATEHGCDSVVMGTRGFGPLKRLVVGSVSRQVLRACEQPVTLVNSIQSRNFGDPVRILVPIDGSPSANRAVQFALRLVQETPRAALHLLHVEASHESAGLAVGRGGTLVEATAIGNAERVFAEATPVLDAASCSHTLHAESGEPAAAIHRISRQLSADWIVMGTRGLGRMASLVIGSVADAVSRQTRIPVTMVR